MTSLLFCDVTTVFFQVIFTLIPANPETPITGFRKWLLFYLLRVSWEDDVIKNDERGDCILWAGLAHAITNTSSMTSLTPLLCRH